MKKRFLNFLRKYWICLLLSVLMVIGISLSTYYAESILYLIIGMPLYSLIYGCLSYIKTKKIWLPQLIIYLITCIYFFGFNLIIDKEIDAWKNILLVSVYPVAFSLIGTSITAFIYYIIKSIKENQN